MFDQKAKLGVGRAEGDPLPRQEGLQDEDGEGHPAVAGGREAGEVGIGQEQGAIFGVPGGGGIPAKLSLGRTQNWRPSVGKSAGSRDEG